MVQINVFAKQKQRHRCREQTYRYQGEGGGDELGAWDQHMYTLAIKDN